MLTHCRVYRACRFIELVVIVLCFSLQVWQTNINFLITAKMKAKYKILANWLELMLKLVLVRLTFELAPRMSFWLHAWSHVVFKMLLNKCFSEKWYVAHSMPLLVMGNEIYFGMRIFCIIWLIYAKVWVACRLSGLSIEWLIYCDQLKTTTVGHEESLPSTSTDSKVSFYINLVSQSQRGVSFVGIS